VGSTSVFRYVEARRPETVIGSSIRGAGRHEELEAEAIAVVTKSSPPADGLR